MYSILFQNNSTEYVADSATDLNQIQAKDTDTVYVIDEKKYYVFWKNQWIEFQRAL